METRIIVAGSRTFNDYERLCGVVDAYIAALTEDGGGGAWDVCIISGGARGADVLGERYAAERGYRTVRCPANWQRYGRGAGLRRNAEMAALATSDGARGILFAFWDGVSRGTKHMIGQAKRYGMECRVERFM